LCFLFFVLFVYILHVKNYIFKHNKLSNLSTFFNRLEVKTRATTISMECNKINGTQVVKIQ